MVKLVTLLLACPLLFTSSFFLSAEERKKEYDFTVCKDGNCDFTTVQEAINAVPDFRQKRTRILIKKGTYKEKLLIPSIKTNISLEGEEADQTIITYDDYHERKTIFGEKTGTSGSATVYVYGDGFRAVDLTFENTAGKEAGQAVAMRVDGDRVTFDRCRFLGNQDTLYLHGKKSRQYYKDCYIEGTVDFIFGWSTGWFENCVIYCKSKGYITAASTQQENPYGLIFNNCTITGPALSGSVYLGRPWRPYAHTIFMNCYLSEVVRPEGWDPWRSEEKKKTARYYEYHNSGPGSGSAQRVKWASFLTNKEIESITLQKVMGDWKVVE